MRLLGLTKLTTSYVHIKLQVSFRLDKIYGVSEVDSSVSLKFRLNLSWYENRLVYHNLKKDRNVVSCLQAITHSLLGLGSSILTTISRKN